MRKRGIFTERLNSVMGNRRKKVNEAYDKKTEYAAKQIVDDLAQASYYDVLDAKVAEDGSFEGSYVMNKVSMQLLEAMLEDFEDGKIEISNFNLNRSEEVRDFYIDGEWIEFILMNDYYEIFYSCKWASSKSLEYNGNVNDDYMHPIHTVGGLTGLR